MERSEEKSCDIRVWCEECKNAEYTTVGDKYKCSTCGKILNEHGVHHEIFPHVVGDKDHLS
jgi:ribosomal protein S27E